MLAETVVIVMASSHLGVSLCDLVFQDYWAGSIPLDVEGLVKGIRLVEIPLSSAVWVESLELVDVLRRDAERRRFLRVDVHAIGVDIDRASNCDLVLAVVFDYLEVFDVSVGGLVLWRVADALVLERC